MYICLTQLKKLHIPVLRIGKSKDRKKSRIYIIEWDKGEVDEQIINYRNQLYIVQEKGGNHMLEY